ncbi:MAG TPA: hypothetical protein VG693_12130 [Actinomycetes bacterium]|nr:hypothetical protein [Actinomycetes bacterium]
MNSPQGPERPSGKRRHTSWDSMPPSSVSPVTSRIDEGGVESQEVWRRYTDGHSGPCGEFTFDTLRRLEEAGFNADAWDSTEWRR